MEAADDGEIFFVNPILGSYEVEYDEEEDDESWIDRPWSETGVVREELLLRDHHGRFA
jgi:hypothetical protein